MGISNFSKTPRDISNYLVELIVSTSEIKADDLEDSIKTYLRQLYYKGTIPFNIYYRGKIFLGTCSSEVSTKDMSKMPIELRPIADYLIHIQDANQADRRLLKTVLIELFEPSNHRKLRHYFTDAVINTLKLRIDYSLDFLKEVSPDNSISYPEFEKAFYYHLIKYRESKNR